MWRDVVTKYGSNLVISLDECCHSALSEKNILYRRDADESTGEFFDDDDDTVWSFVGLTGVGLSAINKE